MSVSMEVIDSLDVEQIRHHQLTILLLRFFAIVFAVGTVFDIHYSSLASPMRLGEGISWIVGGWTTGIELWFNNLFGSPRYKAYPQWLRWLFFIGGFATYIFDYATNVLGMLVRIVNSQPEKVQIFDLSQPFEVLMAAVIGFVLCFAEFLAIKLWAIQAGMNSKLPETERVSSVPGLNTLAKWANFLRD